MFSTQAYADALGMQPPARQAASHPPAQTGALISPVDAASPVSRLTQLRGNLHFAMPRLFTGLEVPPEIGQRLAALRGGLPGARWIEPTDYHITLRFLGDVDGRTAREVTRFLDDIAGQPIPVSLEGLESFGGDKPRAVFARAQAHPALVALQADHERLMRQCGLAPEPRKFRPHVTLARLRDAMAMDVARYLTQAAIVQPLRFVASRFVLYSSRDSVGGGPYVVEAAYPLGFGLGRAS